MEELKNEQLVIKIAEMGAELQSIKDAQGREYLWQAPMGKSLTGVDGRE